MQNCFHLFCLVFSFLILCFKKAPLLLNFSLHFCSEISLSSFSFFLFQWIHLFTAFMFFLPSILGYRIRAETQLDWGTEVKVYFMARVGIRDFSN